MKKTQAISTLKTISILIFLSIAAHGEHVSVPFGLVFIISFYDLFENIKKSVSLEHLSVILSFFGLILILLSIKGQKKIFTLIGYFLTYIMLFGSLFETNILLKPEKNMYYFITASLYFLISIFILIRTIQSSKKTII
jgi:hypothetical protein